MNQQNILHFGQHILLLALYSLIILGILGGLDFTGTFWEAFLLTIVSIISGFTLSWLSGATFLKKFDFWRWKYSLISAGIIFIIVMIAMVTS